MKGKIYFQALRQMMSFAPAMVTNKKWINRGLFFVLVLIWGSSFILMKLGLYDNKGNAVLSAYQVAAIRLCSAGLALLPFALKEIRNIPFNKIGLIILSGLLGTFFPAFLFCVAETKIDSSLAGSVNSLTPIFAIIAGVMIYHTKVSVQKVAGIIVGFLGCLGLLLSKQTGPSENVWYAFFVVAASILYGINANMVRHKLHDVGSMNIAAFAFLAFTFPALLVLIATGYFRLPLSNPVYLKATFASVVLGVIGTAVASVIFYMLVKRAGPIFASMVTYGIPFVALFWGWLAGENISWLQVASILVILTGVYLGTIEKNK